MTYNEKLKDPRWQRKRLDIFNRDGFQCVVCHSGERTLNAHHVKYIGENPWETPDEYIVTLCEECHTLDHSINDDGIIKILTDI